MAWKGIVGLSFDVLTFDLYCQQLEWEEWRPQFIVLHNTASPSLAQRPNGLTRTHIGNLENHYKNENGWSAGPHLFIDDRQIHVFTPLTTPGVHSPSYNRVSIGAEMLGDFEKEAFDTGRGAKVRDNAVSAIASLCDRLSIDTATLRLHREDPKTTHSCPGKNVNRASFVARVRSRKLEIMKWRRK
jgi:N-acetylmuramoyl-L-alanine amidase CwlA